MLGALLLTACGTAANAPSEESTPRPSVSGVSGTARVGVDRLVSRTGKTWSVSVHELFGTASHLEGSAPGALVSGDGAKSTLAFLTEYRDIFSMRAPAEELRVTRERTDDLGTRHVRMQQIVNGLRVVDAELMAHFDKSGALVTLDARYVPELHTLDTVPALTKDAALSLATADALSGRKLGTEPSEPELVVYAPGTKAPRLAYHVRVRVQSEMPQIMVYEIDAKTGAVLNQYDDIQTVTGSGKGVKGDTKKIEVTSQGGSYVLIDSTRTANNITTNTASGSQTTPGSLVTSSSMTSWDTGGAGAPGSAVDAHYHAGVVYDYYKKTHNRAGIDGKDGAVISTVHFSQNYDNAFWDGQQMVYGDGDGQMFYGFAAGMDVVGHELTHGVTQSESNLTYQTQSGALNEAMSDIMSSFVEHYGKPDPVNNWLLGEDIGPSPTRDMVHPSKGNQPAHMSQFVNTSQDNGGVHINSGIVNNAAYLMTMGGTNDKSGTKVEFGVGWDKSAKLWYLTNTQYLTSGSNFAAAAAANKTAAKALNFTQNEQNIVECAWIAVGVLTGSCQTITDPATSSGGGGGGNTDTDAGTHGTGGGDGNGNGTNGSGSNGNNDTSGSGSNNGNGNGNGTSNGNGNGNQSGGYGGQLSGLNSTPTSSGCSVTNDKSPDTGSFAAFGLAMVGLVGLRRRDRKTV